MSTAVIVAIITGLCTAIPTVVTSVMVNNKNHAILEYKVDELAAKVEKHNGVVERTALLEQSVSTLWKDVDNLKEK